MKTFRKSSLITSVALLLVAIVALGGATFAWFSSSPTANANNLSVTSTSAGGLLISEDGDTYASTINYTNTTADGRATTLKPASSAFANDGLPTFYFGEAKSADSFEIDGTDTFTNVTSASDAQYYNKYDLYAKAANGTGSLKVKITADSLQDAGGYGRLAITDDAGNLLFYYTQEQEGDPVTGTASNAVDASFYTTNKDVVVSAEGAEKTLCDDLNTTAQLFYIYVWNEGQDPDCVSANANKTMAANLYFEFVEDTTP